MIKSNRQQSHLIRANNYDIEHERHFSIDLNPPMSLGQGRDPSLLSYIIHHVNQISQIFLHMQTKLKLKTKCKRVLYKRCT